MQPINNSSHYQGKDRDAIRVIETFDMNFRLGNAMKYIIRSGKKEDPTRDLRKAIWYISREIDSMKK